MASTINPAYRIRPLGLGDVLDEAFRIYRARFGLMFGTAAVAGIPGLVFGLGGGGGTLATQYMQTFGALQGSADTSFNPFLLTMLGLGAILFVLFLPVTMAAPHFAAAAAALGLPATVGTIVRFTFRNYFRLWVLAGVTWLVSLGYAFLGLTVYLLVRWSFVFDAFYLERSDVGGSFNRSMWLTTNAWWRTFGIRLLTKFITWVIAVIVGLMFSLPTFLIAGGPLRLSVAGVLGALVAIVLVPFPALVCTLLYLDQRVRLEALDLQLMAGQAGTGQPGPDSQPQAGYQQPQGGDPSPPAEVVPTWGQAAPTWAPPPSTDLPPPSR